DAAVCVEVRDDQAGSERTGVFLPAEQVADFLGVPRAAEAAGAYGRIGQTALPKVGEVLVEQTNQAAFLDVRFRLGHDADTSMSCVAAASNPDGRGPGEYGACTLSPLPAAAVVVSPISLLVLTQRQQQVSERAIELRGIDRLGRLVQGEGPFRSQRGV